MKHRASHRLFVGMERAALRRARLILTNSERTRQDLLERFNLCPERIHTVYYGIDAERFHAPAPEEKAYLRIRLAWPVAAPFVTFIGALGDRRKGFDTLFTAWQALCRDPAWDAQLAVIGTGAELPHWLARTAEARLSGRIHFLGFRTDVPDVLRASDALVAPTRYEAYWLGVHEALCCGLPALVSAAAGVAERYPAPLRELLLPDPVDAADLAARLRAWHTRRVEYTHAVAALAAQLRAYSWEDMAARMVELIESGSPRAA